MKIREDKWALILGGLSFVLFATEPYIVDIIQPAKSIGQLIGENAKDVIDGLNGDKQNSNGLKDSRRIWSNSITILSFILSAVALIMAVIAYQNHNKKWYALGGGLLSIIGLGIYFSHLAIGGIGSIIIAILVVVIVVLGIL